MNKTLLILSTHFVDETVISEYKKMRDTPDVDAILAIDNTAYKYEFKNRIENKIFDGISVRCFFFDSILHDELKLPYFSHTNIKKFSDVMWHNGDYRFYYVRKYFPDYDYYWQFDYDVFCNAPTYEGFLKKFVNDRSDFLVQKIELIPTTDIPKFYAIEWIYKTADYYMCIYPVVRLSARAVDFLYRRRLEHKKIYNPKDDKKKWINCEPFTATELMNNGFYCADIDEENVTSNNNIYLNDNRIFLKPDNKLYHPVKYIGKELFELKKKFRTFLLKSLISLSFGINANDFKKYHIHFNEDFTFSAIPIVGRGKQNKAEFFYTVQFLDNFIILALHCRDRFKNIGIEPFKPYEDLLKDFIVLQNDEETSISTYVPKAFEFDNIHSTIIILKKLIHGTFPVINKYLKGG